VPPIRGIHDPWAYGIGSHHSHVDTHDRLVIESLAQAAPIVALTVRTLANRDAMPPRVPAAPAATGSG
jgi:hypothetical protein